MSDPDPKKPVDAPQFDEVLKRMLSTPPEPKRAKPEKKDERKKPAAGAG
jgi:hypothetical protein